MTTDTAVAESETEVAEFPPWPIAEETLASREDWLYLFVDGMPVRPATDEEKASYAARYEDGTWEKAEALAVPHVVLPPSDEVAQLTQIAAGAAEPAQAVPDKEARAAADEQAQREAFTTLARWTAGKSTKLADPEVAKPDPDAEVVEGTVVSQDTQVLEPLPPEAT